MIPRVIFIEAGHGKGALFNDNGATGSLDGKKYTERDLAVIVTEKVYTILRAKPELQNSLIFGVGSVDRLTVSQKMGFVNKTISEKKIDPRFAIGVAIHLNSGAASANGVEVWTQKRNETLGNQLAHEIIDSVAEYRIFSVRPTSILPTSKNRYGRLYIDDAKCPYILIELGFISNSADLRALVLNLDRVALMIAHGIMEFSRA